MEKKYNAKNIIKEIKRICRNTDSSNPCEVNIKLLEIIDLCNEIKI